MALCNCIARGDSDAPLALFLLLIAITSQVSCLDEGDGRIQYYLANRHSEHECNHLSVGLDFVTIEGSVKMSTAPPPPSQRRQKICQTPLVPFGKLTQDRRGINFWYLRLKVTQLLPGQTLIIVTTDFSDINSMMVEKDQRIDMTHKSHAYPAILYLKYRYARLYWNSTHDPGLSNWANITVSTYARFNDSVNATIQKELCERYSNTWCERSKSTICIGPSSCSLQEDCFDSFSDPSMCSDALWINGNLTTAGSSLRTTGWILRNLPWLALGIVPLVLVIALAKICSQKRDLDIDDDYEYKVSYSDHNAEGCGRNGAAVCGADDTEDAESSSSSDNEGVSGADGPGPYYSYPSPSAPNNRVSAMSPSRESRRTEEATLNESDSNTEKGRDGAKTEEAQACEKSLDAEDDDAPPPPPPRLSQAQTAVGTGVGVVVARNGSLSAGSASGRALHRLTEVSLEEEDDERAGGNARGSVVKDEDEEEEEFVNVEYLRRQMQQPGDPDHRVPSGEYTSATGSDPDAPSPRSSYTRLLSQPSPETIEELLRPSPPVCETTDGCNAGGGNGVVYAQLVLPPPTRNQAAAAAAAAAAASVAANSPPTTDSLELQPVRAPIVSAGGKVGTRGLASPTAKKPERGSYDSNYIVV